MSRAVLLKSSVLNQGCILEEINMMLIRGNVRNVRVRQIGMRFIVGTRNLNLHDFFLCFYFDL